MELTIAQLERNTADGGVTVAHWPATKTAGEHTASSYGTVSFQPDPDAEGFIPFEELTVETVTGWVQEALDLEGIEAGLDANLELQANPVTASGLPW